jgi:NADH-quinone oxidoreductase subunit H
LALESLGLSPQLTWLVWTLIKLLAVSIVALTLIPIIIWGERKVSAHIQFRPGPNRVGVYGLLQPIADVFKLAFKEELKPDQAHTIIYSLAPLVSVIPAIVIFSIIPVGPDFVATDVNVGILIFFAVTSMAVYTVTLAGWAGNNKYSLLGGLRASAQMFSYELGMGLSVIGVILLAGSLSLVDIVNAQSGYWFGFIPRWFIFLQPIGFFSFFIAMFAETNPVWGGFIWTFVKVAIVFNFFYLVRWTFPRFRYDQLMEFGWKVLLPVTLANTMLTALVVYLIEGGSR